MGIKSEHFGELLSKAVRHIANQENKPIAVVQDELGFALGRNAGGSAIEYWRRGHFPADLADLEELARELTGRQGLDRAECHQFLRSGDHPTPDLLLEELFTTSQPAQAAAELSPFVVGPPITTPRQFFGRQRELQRIFHLWQQLPLEHVAIVGLRRSGKTSLLYYLKQITTTCPTELRPDQRFDYLPQPEHVRWVLVDFQDPRHRRQEKLLQYLLAELDMPVPDLCTQENFLDIVSEHLYTPAVILMDELEAGLTAPELDQDFWWSLRALANHYTQGRLAFVLTAGQAPLQLAQAQGQSSPFFNIFHVLELEPLTEPEARELIASSPRPFAPNDVAWILEQSGRWPCLLQVLCQTHLMAMTEHLHGDNWRTEASKQLEPYQYLLDLKGSRH
jgi:hypothetical protein